MAILKFYILQHKIYSLEIELPELRGDDFETKVKAREIYVQDKVLEIITLFARMIALGYAYRFELIVDSRVNEILKEENYYPMTIARLIEITDLILESLKNDIDKGEWRYSGICNWTMDNLSFKEDFEYKDIVSEYAISVNVYTWGGLWFRTYAIAPRIELLENFKKHLNDKIINNSTTTINPGNLG